MDRAKVNGPRLPENPGQNNGDRPGGGKGERGLGRWQEERGKGGKVIKCFREA